MPHSPDIENVVDRTSPLFDRDNPLGAFSTCSIPQSHTKIEHFRVSWFGISPVTGMVEPHYSYSDPPRTTITIDHYVAGKKPEIIQSDPDPQNPNTEGNHPVFSGTTTGSDSAPRDVPVAA
jgi:hypothetical protein